MRNFRGTAIPKDAIRRSRQMRIGARGMFRKDVAESLGQFPVSRSGLMRILALSSAADLANDNQSTLDWGCSTLRV